MVADHTKLAVFVARHHHRVPADLVANNRRAF